MTGASTDVSFLSRTALPLLLAVAVLVVLAGIGYRVLTEIVETTEERKENREALLQAERAISYLKDAETGQRGYVITGQPEYLEPYHAGRAGVAAVLGAWEATGPGKVDIRKEVGHLRPMVDRQLALLAEVVALREAQGEHAAGGGALQDGVRTGMDALRKEVGRMTSDLQRQIQSRDVRLAELERQGRLIALGLGVLLPMVLIGAYWLVLQEYRRRIEAEAAAHEFDLLRQESAQKLESQARLAATMEESARRNAELASVFEVLPDLYFRFGRDGTILDYRARTAAELYVPPEVFMGKRVQDVLPTAVSQAFRQQIETLLAQEENVPGSFEYSLDMPDGRRHSYEALMGRLKERAEVVTVVRDISARLASQRALRQWADAFEHCAHGIALGDARTNRLIACNPAFAALLGWTPAELSGREIATVYAPTERQELAQRIAKADGEGSVRYEAEMLRRDGSTVLVQVDLVSVRNEEQPPPYRVATIQDITIRRQAEDAIRRVQDDLRTFARRLDENIEQERKRLAREVHDQLGQLFTALKIRVDSLGSMRGPADDVAAGLRQISELLNEGVRISRRLAAELRPPALDDLGLPTAVDILLRDYCRQSGLDCRARLAEEPRLDKPASLQLYRIIQEALTNVVRHARAHRVEIDGRVEDGNYRLTVDDDGCGLPAMPRERSFGITSMAERAEVIGATFAMLPSPMGGARVEVRLPLESEEATEGAIDAAADPR
jgi:PAS domain S-box-containing protein